MDIHIGKEIENVANKRNTSAAVLGEEINTGRRNVYQIFSKPDINVSQLWKISEALKFNFFELFHPVIAEGVHVMNEPQAEYQKKLTVNFNVEYPLSKASELGTFIMHVHAIAEKMGFKMV
jgi:hypothetical protein